MLRQLLPVLLLTISNIFMTFAWYGHLKYKGSALWIVILISWGIALFEYCFQVPANRIGHEYFTAAQLKTMQEVITLIVFSLATTFCCAHSMLSKSPNVTSRVFTSTFWSPLIYRISFVTDMTFSTPCEWKIQVSPPPGLPLHLGHDNNKESP